VVEAFILLPNNMLLLHNIGLDIADCTSFAAFSCDTRESAVIRTCFLTKVWIFIFTYNLLWWVFCRTTVCSHLPAAIIAPTARICRFTTLTCFNVLSTVELDRGALEEWLVDTLHFGCPDAYRVSPIHYGQLLLISFG